MSENVSRWVVEIGDEANLRQILVATKTAFGERSYVITAQTLDGDAFAAINPGWAVSERLENLPFRYLPGNEVGANFVQVPRAHTVANQRIAFEIRKWSKDAPPPHDAFDFMAIRRGDESAATWIEYLESEATW